MTGSPLSSPTFHLPPIGKIKCTPLEDLKNALELLRALYNPVVHSSRLLGRQSMCPRVHITSEDEIDFEQLCRRNTDIMTRLPFPSDRFLDLLRSDDFERSYAIRWLTALVSQADRFVDYYDEDTCCNDPVLEQQKMQWEKLIEDAAAILAICAGSASAGTISRTFVFHQPAGLELRVQVTDLPLQNQDFSSVGAQTWGGARVLAEMIIGSPRTFGIELRGSTASPIRILELGAGTGLVSLATGKLFQAHSARSIPATIIASDFNPAVLANLQHNIDINFTALSGPSPTNIFARALDWSTFPSSSSIHVPFDTPFDVIFGADIIYEAEHAAWIKNCVRVLLRHPLNSFDTPQFHLVVPLRPTHTAELRSIEETFLVSDGVRDTPGGDELGIVAKEFLACQADWGVRSKHEDLNIDKYVHYTIAWVKTGLGTF
ncbi:hypothetical protein C8Q75DRAFT_730795 [Abortiporus biennis]|nr:hypothetical protein C8Q75DRAFT_730795 [Abortiporus biennis]